MSEANRSPFRKLASEDFEQGEGSGEPDLRPIADQLIGIAEQLRSGAAATTLRSEISNDDGVCEDGLARWDRRTRLEAVGSQAANPSRTHDASGSRQAYGKMAIRQYERRRRRTAIFGNAELFGEPAWDILLDLYIAFIQDKPVSVSSACIGSAAPPTTGLRWLGVLCDQGLTLREHDPNDQRRVLVRLTDRGVAAMDAYFASARDAG